jgi:N-methylhydantoinase B
LYGFSAKSLAPGDVLSPQRLVAGNRALARITVAKPIFRKAKLVAFSASTAHAPDIGGKIAVEPREVFEEGLQIPPMKLLRADHPDETLVALIPGMCAPLTRRW